MPNVPRQRMLAPSQQMDNGSTLEFRQSWVHFWGSKSRHVNAFLLGRREDKGLEEKTLTTLPKLWYELFRPPCKNTPSNVACNRPLLCSCNAGFR